MTLGMLVGPSLSMYVGTVSNSQDMDFNHHYGFVYLPTCEWYETSELGYFLGFWLKWFCVDELLPYCSYSF